MFFSFHVHLELVRLDELLPTDVAPVGLDAQVEPHVMVEVGAGGERFKDLMQELQAYGLSPVWILTCLSSRLGRSNFLPHVSQGNNLL